MGRTKRQRSTRSDLKSTNVCYDERVINLQKWMSKKGWRNDTNLKIKSFLETGRGISAKRKILTNDILISIPLEIMVTYNTLKSELVVKEKLTMHEYLALFLVIEKVKGNNSNWLEYIQSLPEKAPPLPCLATPEEVELFPSDLRVIVEKITENFKAFLNRVKKSIPEGCVWKISLLKWAYAMVNTRAVYVDPRLICSDSNVDTLIDEPSMALCPFLDMFNHHYSAKTEANLVCEREGLIYQLRTLTGYKSYEQIFISYGSHDNVKLLTEYGFFIPNNRNDIVRFTLEEVLGVLKFHLDQNKYKFIKQHGLQKEMYVGYDGASYSLKAVIFIGCFVETKRLDSIIFSDTYPSCFLKENLPILLRTLLEFKIEKFIKDVTKLESGVVDSDSAKTVLNFVRYRISVTKQFKTTV